MVSTRLQRCLIGVLTLCFLYIAGIALTPPATSYDVSIYAGIPIPTLVLFGGLLIAAILVLCYSIVEGNLAATGIGMLGSGVAYFGFFHFPLARGYPLYAGFGNDTLVHIGVIKDILSTGELPFLQYPATRVVFAALSSVLDISPQTLIWPVGFFYFMLFIISIATFVWRVTQNVQLTSAACLASLPPIFGMYRFSIMPWLFAFSLLFFSLVSLDKCLETARKSHVVIYTVLISALTIYHPYTAVFAVITNVSYCFIYYIYFHRSRSMKFPLATVIVTPLVLIGPHIIQQTVDGYLAAAFLHLVSMNTGGGASAAQQASSFDYTLVQLLTRFIVPVWGVVLCYYAISGLTVLHAVVRARGSELPRIEAFVSSQYVIAGIISVGLLLVSVFAQNILRASQFLIVVSVIAVAIGLQQIGSWVKGTRSSRAAVIVLVLIMVPIVGLDVSTSYPSNQHVTEKTTAGYEWHLDNKDRSQETIADTGRDRYADLYFGYTEAQNHLQEGDRIYSERDIPDRLGYDRHETISASLGLNRSAYLVTRTADRRWYQAEPQWRHEDLEFYTESEFRKLKSDESARRVYSNGGFSVWLVE